MPSELVAFSQALDTNRLRFVRPSKFIFLCGGSIPDHNGIPASLRHYLLGRRNIRRRLRAEIVLAERANQLYRDSNYRDLITFEEHIALLSSVVCVISESPGSLAELGAFSSNDKIRKALVVIVQQQYQDEESFIRYGPIAKVLTDDNDRVGFFPWRTRGNGSLIIRSASPHYNSIVDFLNQHIDQIPTTTSFRSTPEIADYAIVLWLIYLSGAITLHYIDQYLEDIGRDIAYSDLRNILYSLRLSGWVTHERYSNREYYYTTNDQDPLDYAFLRDAEDHDSLRWKTSVISVIRQELRVPDPVLQNALNQRARGTL